MAVVQHFEIHSRIRGLQELLRQNHIFAVLIQKPKNLYYYSGSGQPANLWVPAEGDPILFSRRAFTLTKEDSSIPNIQMANSFREMVQYLKEVNGFPAPTHYIGVETDIVPYNVIKKLKESFLTSNIKNITNIIMSQRLIKSEYEIQQIRNAAVLWTKGHEAILKSEPVGKKEYELAALMEYEARRNGGDGFVSFHRWDGCLPGGGIVASQENSWIVSGHAMTVTGVGLSPALPWGASNRTLQTGEMVVFDYGICKEAYHCDMARTYSIGKANPKQMDLWKRLVEVHLQVIDQVKPGVTGAQLYFHALEIVRKIGLEDYFMGVENDRGTYIGHSIGLEIDEWPVIGPKANEPLEVNSIITLEPKFMIPELGSVMVEDDLLITPNGYEIIGSVGHELFEIS